MSDDKGRSEELERLDRDWEQICDHARLGFRGSDLLPDSPRAKILLVILSINAAIHMLNGFLAEDEFVVAVSLFGAGSFLVAILALMRLEKLFRVVRLSHDRQRSQLVTELQASE